MKYGVLVQPSAKAEMREAYRWYYNQSPAAARRWLDKLLKTIDTLRTQPERCALAPENDAFEETIRSTERSGARIGSCSRSRKASSKCFTSATRRDNTSVPMRFKGPGCLYDAHWILGWRRRDRLRAANPS